VNFFFGRNEVLVQLTDDILESRMWGLRWLAAGLVVVFVAEWVGGRDDLGITSVFVAMTWATAEFFWWVSHRLWPGAGTRERAGARLADCEIAAFQPIMPQENSLTTIGERHPMGP